MVKEIKAYRDASGTIHENALDAHRADLALWFGKSEAISQTSAQQLANSIANDRDMLDELLDMLSDIGRHMPPRQPDTAPLAVDDDSTVDLQRYNR